MGFGYDYIIKFHCNHENELILYENSCGIDNTHPGWDRYCDAKSITGNGRSLSDWEVISAYLLMRRSKLRKLNGNLSNR